MITLGTIQIAAMLLLFAYALYSSYARGYNIAVEELKEEYTKFVLDKLEQEGVIKFVIEDGIEYIIPGDGDETK